MPPTIHFHIGKPKSANRSEPAMACITGTAIIKAAVAIIFPFIIPPYLADILRYTSSV